jgi:hypothetical protein
VDRKEIGFHKVEDISEVFPGELPSTMHIFPKYSNAITPFKLQEEISEQKIILIANAKIKLSCSITLDQIFSYTATILGAL